MTRNTVFAIALLALVVSSVLPAADRYTGTKPTSLEDALGALEADEAVRAWFEDPFVDIYLKHKRGELAFLENMTPEEACVAYEKVY